MTGQEWAAWVVAMVGLLALAVDLWRSARRRRAAVADLDIARLRTAVRDPEAYSVPVMSEALRQALANIPAQRAGGEDRA